MKRIELIDLFKKLEKKPSELAIRSAFGEIGKWLINKAQITAGRTPYRICELEFYYNNPFTHPDPYTREHDLLLENMKWYFHPSGMDLTFGDGTNMGGITIRAIRKLTGNEDYIAGPLKVKEELALSAGYKNGKELRAALNGADANDESSMLRIEREDLDKIAVFSGPRFNLKNPELDPMKAKFQVAYYRYFAYPLLEHRGKESVIIRQWLEDGAYQEENIKKIFGKASL